MSRARHGYRHVYGDAARIEGQFVDVPAPMTSGEGNFITANSKFIAFARSGAGSPVYVLNASNPGRVSKSSSTLCVHKGKSLDFQFNPFMHNMLGTCGEDTYAAMTIVNDDWVNGTGGSNITTPDVTLKGHSKKVTLIRFNPQTANIVGTVGFDKCVKIWNIEKASEIVSLNDCNEAIYSGEWNYDGTRVATVSKDKKLRIFDPRGRDTTMVTSAFEGTKAAKLFWVDKHQMVGATGFSKTAKRQLKLWDCRKLEAPIYDENIDSAASVQIPYYDPDNSLLYVYGKGSGTVNYYAILDDTRMVHSISNFRSTESQKGGAWAPKMALDVWKCEIARFYKLTSKSIIPVSFICPRKAGADVFQEDLYPDTAGVVPSMTADEWQSGEEKPPILTSLDPAKRAEASSSELGSTMSFTKKATYEELLEENEQLKAEVETLRAELAALRGAQSSTSTGEREDVEMASADSAGAEEAGEMASAATENSEASPYLL